jgi:hypothetical protein
MADNNFRSDRGRDPLAELARLIGQGDPHAEDGPHQSYDAERSGTAAADVDWVAEESYGAQDSHVDERYSVQPAPAASHPAYGTEEQGHETEAPAGSRYFSGPAAQFNGFREDETDAYDDEPQRLPAAHQLQGYATAPDHGYEADQPQHGDDADAGDEYYDEAPRQRRRSSLVVAMAIFSLAVVGTAGAFGYRAMFGGSVLPTLPPIIKASNGPNRVAPAYADSQANNANDSKQAGAAITGSTENLVSREEQPVAIEPPKAAPRVVSTIPIITGQGSGQGLGQGQMPPGLSAPAASGQAVANQAAPGHVASAADSPWPPPPIAAAPPPAPSAAPMPAPAQVSSEPKKIHTVVIRSDQSGGADAAPASTAPTAAPVARAQSRAVAAPRTNAPPSGSNAPMSIVPGTEGSAPAPAPQRTRIAAAPSARAPTAVASANSAPAAAPSSGGRYAVQVTSQRSEGEAQTAFRALQAKYPNQLSGRAPIIRRADLGDKGTFYRALVGPFASAEEAAGLCSGLKAAGGNCIVQRN